MGYITCNFFSPAVSQIKVHDGEYVRLFFHQPEDFIRLGHRMMVVRVPDEAVCPEESKTTPPKDAGFDR